MLENGLGETLTRRAVGMEAFVDLFGGTAAVAHFVGAGVALESVSVDLQEYSKILAEAVLLRTEPLPSQDLCNAWLEAAILSANESPYWRGAHEAAEGKLRSEGVRHAREFCEQVGDQYPITQAYGGHYFSPTQALLIDSLLEHLPSERHSRAVLHATLIKVAARIAAAPGHTAQPFQPTETSLPHIASAWSKDVVKACPHICADISNQSTLRRGRAVVSDARTFAATLGPRTLAFVDPPYSAVQYSRFYHVLETIARGGCGPVMGTGRYPPTAERPISRYSHKRAAYNELSSLLDLLATRGVEVVMTFPQHECSNGVSGLQLLETARRRFIVDVSAVSNRFSTLGGNNVGRAARRQSYELILDMKPR